MAVQFTPGRWYASVGGAVRADHGANLAHSQVAIVTWSAGKTQATADADARLMAAAPDLLNALRSALAWIRDEGGSDAGDETTEEIEAAIAKAIGEEPA